MTPISYKPRKIGTRKFFSTVNSLSLHLVLTCLIALSSSSLFLSQARSAENSETGGFITAEARKAPEGTSPNGDESGDNGNRSTPDLEQALIEAISGVFSKMTDLPILLFPEAKDGALKNLQPVLKEKYFVKPEVKSAALKLTEGEKHLYESLSVSLDPFLIKGLPLNEVTLSFTRTEFFRKDLLEKRVLTLTKVDCIQLRMACPLEKLSEFITEQAKKYGHLIPRFKAAGEKTLVYGPMKFLEFSGEVNVTGKFEVVPETRDVIYRIEEIKLGDNHVPGFVIETISSIVNPIFRIEDFPYKLSPTRIVIESSGQDLVIYGENRNFIHKYKKIEYKSDYLKKFLKN